MSAAAPLLVVDATIAVKWLFDDEDYVASAIDILTRFESGAIDLAAPDHLQHEVLNVVRTGVRIQRITVGDAQELVSDFLDLNVPTFTGAVLFRSGFELALRYDCAFYDALYLALAEQANCPFVHADRRLHNTLAGRFKHEFWIEDYRPA